MGKIQKNSMMFALENRIENASGATQLNHTVLCGFHKTVYAELYWKTA